MSILRDTSDRLRSTEGTTAATAGGRPGELEGFKLSPLLHFWRGKGTPGGEAGCGAGTSTRSGTGAVAGRGLKVHAISGALVQGGQQREGLEGGGGDVALPSGVSVTGGGGRRGSLDQDGPPGFRPATPSSPARRLLLGALSAAATPQPGRA